MQRVQLNQLAATDLQNQLVYSLDSSFLFVNGMELVDNLAKSKLEIRSKNRPDKSHDSLECLNENGCTSGQFALIAKRRTQNILLERRQRK